ncbi:hypothetical protein H6F67_03940 [Microcoleus sp. FACHB-1515]|uniref:hypothetical protein n=1 Tax=Cyanophyceae TaxID=3028117 RepID=UPI001681D9E5|nr:hypothetical protein [Microcoleus sp. FACHB-1515]MBD2089004.1 hypothetical protein [Microcoleus sp. FACHB-1515]
MSQEVVKIIMLGLLLLFAIAPFAGLAPLLLVILIGGFASVIWSVAKVLLLGSRDEAEEKT